MVIASYEVAVSPSARAKCKVCKANILKGELRIGTHTPSPDGYTIVKWSHLGCFKQPKQRTLQIDDLDQSDQLSHDQKEKVVAMLNEQNTQKATKRSMQHILSDAQLEPKKMKVDQLKSTLQEHGMAASSSIPEMRKQVEKLKARAEVEGLYAGLSVAQLKDVLENNRQKRTGNKQELIDRCIDGELHGAIPRCPLCGGGVSAFIQTPCLSQRKIQTASDHCLFVSIFSLPDFGSILSGQAWSAEKCQVSITNTCLAHHLHYEMLSLSPCSSRVDIHALGFTTMTRSKRVSLEAIRPMLFAVHGSAPELWTRTTCSKMQCLRPCNKPTIIRSTRLDFESVANLRLFSRRVVGELFTVRWNSTEIFR